MDYETFERQHQKSYMQMQEIAPASLGIRKRIRLFSAKQGKAPVGIVALTQKSRILLKDVEVLESIVTKLEHHTSLTYARRLLLLEGPLCSKARASLEALGWEIP